MKRWRARVRTRFHCSGTSDQKSCPTEVDALDLDAGHVRLRVNARAYLSRVGSIDLERAAATRFPSDQVVL